MARWLFASAGTSICGRREAWWLLARVITVFPAFHFGYGMDASGLGPRFGTRAAPLTATLR